MMKVSMQLSFGKQRMLFHGSRCQTFSKIRFLCRFDGSGVSVKGANGASTLFCKSRPQTDRMRKETRDISLKVDMSDIQFRSTKPSSTAIVAFLLAAYPVTDWSNGQSYRIN